MDNVPYPIPKLPFLNRFFARSIIGWCECGMELESFPPTFALYTY